MNMYIYIYSLCRREQSLSEPPALPQNLKNRQSESKFGFLHFTWRGGQSAFATDGRSGHKGADPSHALCCIDVYEPYRLMHKHESIRSYACVCTCTFHIHMYIIQLARSRRRKMYIIYIYIQYRTNRYTHVVRVCVCACMYIYTHIYINIIITHFSTVHHMFLHSTCMLVDMLACMSATRAVHCHER